MKILGEILINLVALIVILGLSFLLGFPIMCLWNWIIVPIGLPALTFWKAVGLHFLIHALFIPQDPLPYPDKDKHKQ